MTEDLPFHELHGITRQPFPDFAEMATYLERVTIPTQEQAIEVLQAYGADWGDPHEAVKPIWMRYTTDAADLAAHLGYEEQDARLAMDEYTECWLECEASHPGAVPFWKDSEE